jgi:ankyrin repeat protein
MLQGGMDPNLPTSIGTRPLIVAAKKKNPELLRILIAGGADLESRDPNEATPLIAAVSAGLGENAEFLIAAGADLNARYIKGLTALFWAALKGYPHILESLIARGADPEAKNHDGATALQVSRMILANTRQSLSAASSGGHPETQAKLKAKAREYEKVVQILEKAEGKKSPPVPAD